jgi:hypothetical protein
MKGRIFMALFALPFFGVGVWMGWSIGNTVYDSIRMAGWVPVEARLTSGGYETHSGDDSDTFEAFAEYSYTYEGRTYTSNRVGTSSGGDNIGSYQQDLGRKLGRALANGESIEIRGRHRPRHSLVADRIQVDLRSRLRRIWRRPALLRMARAARQGYC